MLLRPFILILILSSLYSCNILKDRSNDPDTVITAQLKDANGSLIPAGATVWVASDDTTDISAQKIKAKAIDINLDCATPTGDFEQALCVNDSGQITIQCQDKKKKVFVTYKDQTFPLKGLTCDELAETIEVPANISSFLVVASTGPSTLTTLDIPGHTILSSIFVDGGTPDTMAVTPSGLFLYVMNILGDDVTVINTVTKAVVGSFAVGDLPYNAKFSADGKRYYAVNRGVASDVDPEDYTGSFMIFDTKDNSLKQELRIGRLPSGIALSVDGNKIYVSCAKENTITVIDAKKLNVINTIDVSAVGAGPEDLLISADGSKLYVAAGEADGVVIIDTSNDSIITSFPSGDGSVGLDIIGDKLYVLNLFGDTMTVHNVSDNALVATIPVGTRPYKLAVSPDNKYIYVSNFLSHDVTIIDPATNSVLETIGVGDYPVGLAVNPFGE